MREYYDARAEEYDDWYLSALPPHGQPVRRERRILSDGSEFQVYKRYFDGDDLVSEFGGDDVIQRSRSFVVVSVGRGSRGSR